MNLKGSKTELCLKEAFAGNLKPTVAICILQIKLT